MPLDVQMVINGEVVESVHVINTGPSNSLEADKPDGERIYRWTHHRADGSIMSSGTVYHRRARGARQLAAKALTAALALHEAGRHRVG